MFYKTRFNFYYYLLIYYYKYNPFIIMIIIIISKRISHFIIINKTQVVNFCDLFISIK